MNRLNLLVKSLESKIVQCELINPVISKSSVGWHIEHTLLVLNSVTEHLKNSNSLHYKPRFSLNKIIIFTINKIPRGRANAPFIVVPKFYNSETLKSHIESVKEKLKCLNELKPSQYFEHPYFGHLRSKEAVRFLEIHTDHHIKIIEDIISKIN